MITARARWPAHLLAAGWALVTLVACGGPKAFDAETLEGSVGRVFCQVGKTSAVGSGFVIEQGHIMTNAHVVEVGDKPCSALEVALAPGQRFAARVVEIDRERDLALVAVDGETPPPLTLAPGKTRKSAALYVIGFPSAADQVPRERTRYVSPSVSKGVVNRELPDAKGFKVIQTGAAMNPGNSGGPALDACGRVIGIATRVRRGGLVEQLNFAVHAEEVAGFLDRVGRTVAVVSQPCAPADPLDVVLSPVTLVSLGLVVCLGVLLVVVRRRTPVIDPVRPHEMHRRQARRRDETQRSGRFPSPGPPAPEPEPTAPPTPQCCVRIVEGPAELIGTVHGIAPGFTIGRDPAIATVCVPIQANGISRRHVELRVRKGRVEVKDCWSSTGTRLDARKLEPGQWMAAAPGTRIRLGRDAMVVKVE